MRLRLWFMVLLILASLSAVVAARAVTTFFTSYMAGTGFVVTVDEVRIVQVDLSSAASMRVKVSPVVGQTQAATVYTIRVTLDTGVTANGTVSWTAPQITAGTPQNITVSGLTGVASSDWAISVTR